jgi:hypothetical protein
VVSQRANIFDFTWGRSHAASTFADVTRCERDHAQAQPILLPVCEVCRSISLQFLRITTH